MIVPPESLAIAFAEKLASWLTPEQFAEIRRRNASPEYKGTGACASHDFCDANEAMLQALEGLANDGTDSPRDGELDIALFNEAWRIALRDHLSE